MPNPDQHPDFPYADDDDLPTREPFRPGPDITPERPDDLIVRPPTRGSTYSDHITNPDEEIPPHWRWLGGKG
jgi:hypothetical protein